MPDLPPVFYFIAFGLLGACVGSFLNVVIYRTPRGLSVHSPSRSFCPTCKEEIPWHMNIPLLSWVILKGKCARCRTNIPIRYWFVEFMTCTLFITTYAMYAGLPFTTIIALCIWVSMSVVIFCIDAELMAVIPWHTVIGTLAGIAACTLSPTLLCDEPTSYIDGLRESFIGLTVGYIIIRLVIELGKLLFGKWQMNFETPQEWYLQEPTNDTEELTLVMGENMLAWSLLFSRKSDKAIMQTPTLVIDGKEMQHNSITLLSDRIEFPDSSHVLICDIKSASGTTTHILANREAMGYGDAWIMMMVGAACGWQGCIFTLVIGSIIGIIIGVILRVGFGKQMPFGPALLLGALAWLFGGHHLWAWYMEFVNSGVAYHA